MAIAQHYDFPFDEELAKKAKKFVQLALRSEVTGILMVHLTQLADDKIKLRSSFQQTMKVYKQLLAPTLGADEQNKTIQSMFLPILQSKIISVLKMK